MSTYNDEITIEDLVAARDAIESWVDAFRDSDPDDAELEAKCQRAEKVAEMFSGIINKMKTPPGPRLRLVKPEEDK